MSAVKFTFHTRFDADGGETAAPQARKKSLTPEEIEIVRRQAHEEGKRDGDVRASQAIAASLGQVAASMHAAIAEIEAIRADAARLALVAAKHLAGAALLSVPEAEIADALTAALHQAIGEPRVTVKTSPLLAEKIEAKTAAIAAEQGFEGRIHFVPDASLAGADCRIEWRGGGIERSHRLIETALADLIARRFPALTAPLQE